MTTMSLDDVRVLVNKRQRAKADRDQAEAVRVECDEALKPELALRGGKVETEEWQVQLVDRELRGGLDEKKLLEAGVAMATLEACRKQSSRSVSVLVTERRG